MGHDLSEDTSNLTGIALQKAIDKELAQYTDLIDEIMREDDRNKDGRLSYLEYSFARRREYQDEKTSGKN